MNQDRVINEPVAIADLPKDYPDETTIYQLHRDIMHVRITTTETRFTKFVKNFLMLY